MVEVVCGLSGFIGLGIGGLDKLVVLSVLIEKFVQRGPDETRMHFD